MEKFRDLRVWQKAHQLVLEIYRTTKDFPSNENYALVSQMRRAAIGVAANIVEGSKRGTVRDRKHFHVIADTSLEELKYYCILSTDLNYFDKKKCDELFLMCRDVGQMLGALTRAL